MKGRAITGTGIDPQQHQVLSVYGVKWNRTVEQCKGEKLIKGRQAFLLGFCATAGYLRLSPAFCKCVVALFLCHMHVEILVHKLSSSSSYGCPEHAY